LQKWHSQLSLHAKLKTIPSNFYVGPICSATLIDAAAEEILIRNDADPEIKNTARSSTNLIKNEADPVNISAIKEELRGSLLSIASKLLKSEHTRLHHLSDTEQQLWNSFEKADIYEFLTGEKDTIPEFQLNWISPEAPAIRQVPSTVQAQPPAAPPPVQPALPPAASPLLAQPAAPVPVVQPAPGIQPVDAQLPPQPAQEVLIADPVPPQEVQPAVPPKPPIPETDRQLRPKKDIDYHELNTGIKKTC